jgi:hypothetical protein
MSEGINLATIHAILDAILAHDLTKPGIARRLALERIEQMPLTDQEWAALVTLFQICEMHGVSLEVFRGLVAMLAAAQPGASE